jgi:hypothetical protein
MDKVRCFVNKRLLLRCVTPEYNKYIIDYESIIKPLEQFVAIGNIGYVAEEQ